MPLDNFGSVLNFAEEMEKQDMAFYAAAAANPACSDRKAQLESFAKGCQKNVQNAQRTRRENVTEMILEPIEDLGQDNFPLETADPAALTADGVTKAAQRIEARAQRFYQAAAVNFKSQPDVARALKTSGKVRAKHQF